MRQQAANQRKPLQNRLGKLEKEIAALEAEKAQLDAVIADPASYEVQHKARLTETIRRQGEVVAKLTATESEWILAQEELEAIA